MTARYKLGCDLSYQVADETMFIFDLEVARLVRHRGLDETIEMQFRLSIEVYEAPDVRNRYMKVAVPAGS